jgi:CBS domain-containing protein
MYVQDVMTRQPTTVTADTAAKRAAALLSEGRITSLPVLDAVGRLCGVVTEADLIREVFAPDSRAHMLPAAHDEPVRATSVSEVMTANATTVHESTDLAGAAEIMTSTGFKSLPVVDAAGRLVGVVSRSDLIRVRARSDELIGREIDALLVSLGHSDWVVDVDDGTVEIAGPATELDQSIAQVTAHTVAGVVTVRVADA